MRQILLGTLFSILASFGAAAPGGAYTEIFNPSLHADELFGSSVSSSRVTGQMIVGAPTSQNNRGRVYVLKTTGQLVTTVESPFAGEDYGSFGSSIIPYSGSFAASAPTVRGTGGV